MKSHVELERELEITNENIASADKHLDAVLRSFAEEITPAVASWIEAEGRRQVKNSYEKIGADAPELVPVIKSEVMALVSNADQLALNALGNSAQWPHKKQLSESDFYTSRSEFLGHVFRRAVSPLGDLLATHKLIDSREGSWKRGASGKYEYAYHAGFEERTSPQAAIYKEALRSHHDLKKRAAELRREIEKAKINDLWDAAD